MLSGADLFEIAIGKVFVETDMGAEALGVFEDQGLSVVFGDRGLSMAVEDRGLLVVFEDQGLSMVVEDRGLLVVFEDQGLSAVFGDRGLSVVFGDQGLSVVFWDQDLWEEAFEVFRDRDLQADVVDIDLADPHDLH